MCRASPREPGSSLRRRAAPTQRGFWRKRDDFQARSQKRLGPPFGFSLAAGAAQGDQNPARCRSPAFGCSTSPWVIAGPTATCAIWRGEMGAEVIKIEAPGRGDPGRASELHTVLGQAKKSVVLDLKKPEAVAVARDLGRPRRCRVRKFRDRGDGPARSRRDGVAGRSTPT